MIFRHIVQDINAKFIVIDSLDNYKKGTSHMNVQARDSIRYLDQKLLENINKNDTPTSSFLRTQKVTEKLTDWSEAKAYWIGEESRSNVVDHLLSEEEEEEEEDQEEENTDTESDISSDEDLRKFRRRRGSDSDVSEDELTSDSEQDDSEAEDDDSSEEEEETKETEVEEFNYNEEFEDEEEDNDDVPYTYNDVPKAYRPFISCLLYYHNKQEARQDNQPERLVLVTNDEDLAWWAELFGDPKTGKRLHVKTVNEWDQMVSKLDFEKVYDYSWNKR